jgi:crotonobetainyl-CoA:carnitine CoA-transferase CaiB-like acyl-CoA transferase
MKMANLGEKRDRTQILEKIKILDLSQIMAGPLCSMILGDLGADVIKVESPEGDAGRSMGETRLKGQSDYLLSLNRNKRSIVIDLKKEKGKDLFFQLAKRTDIILENFKAGTVQKLGIDYPSIYKFNSRIIYCSLSGFGQNGPYRDRPALDPIIEAMGGLMGITGDPRTGPVRVGAPMADLVAPLLGAIGILGAILEREKSGIGQKLEISMLDGVVFSLIPREAYYFITGNSLSLTGNRHYQVAPCNAFQTKEGKYVMLIAHTEKHWLNPCKSLQREDLLSDSRFKTNSSRMKNQDELYDILGKIFQKKTQHEWVEKLGSRNNMIAPVNSLEQTFKDPQILQDEMVVKLKHPLAGEIKVLRTPINLSSTPLKIKAPPPLLGEHTEEILLEHGLSMNEIQQLKKEGIIKAHSFVEE